MAFLIIFLFAWYEVTQGVASATGNKAGLSITTGVVADKGTVAAGLDVRAIEIDASGVLEGETGFAKRSDKLQLIAFANDHSVVHKYYNGTTLIPYAGESGQFDLAVYKIEAKTLDVTDNNVTIMTAAQVATALKTKTLGLSASDSDNNRLEEYFVATAPSAPSDNATTITGYTVQNSDDLTSYVTLGYMVVYAKGNVATSGNETSDDPNSPIGGSITVTVSYSEA